MRAGAEEEEAAAGLGGGGERALPACGPWAPSGRARPGLAAEGFAQPSDGRLPLGSVGGGQPPCSSGKSLF